MSNGSGPVPQAARNDELADFLKNNKADFVKALDAGSSLDGWVIVMGEAISAFYGANHSKYAKFDFTSLPSPEIGNEAGGEIKLPLLCIPDAGSCTSFALV